jgi:hypothetical protein
MTFPRKGQPPCGTPRGYRWHLRWGQYPCASCTEANKHDKNAGLVRRRKIRSVRVPTELLGMLVALVDQSTRSRVEETLGGPVVEACLTVARGGQ